MTQALGAIAKGRFLEFKQIDQRIGSPRDIPSEVLGIH